MSDLVTANDRRLFAHGFVGSTLEQAAVVRSHVGMTGGCSNMAPLGPTAVVRAWPPGSDPSLCEYPAVVRTCPLGPDPCMRE